MINYKANYMKWRRRKKIDLWADYSRALAHLQWSRPEHLFVLRFFISAGWMLAFPFSLLRHYNVLEVHFFLWNVAVNWPKHTHKSSLPWRYGSWLPSAHFPVTQPKCRRTSFICRNEAAPIDTGTWEVPKNTLGPNTAFWMEACYNPRRAAWF